MDCVKNARAAAAFSSEKMRKVNLFDTPRMFCDVYGLNPGQEQAVHAHPGADKVYVVLDGAGDFRIGDSRHSVAAEHVVLAPAGVPHAVRNPGPDRLVLLVFMAPKP